MRITTIGIDIGKTWFHLVGFSADGTIVIRRRCTRQQLVTYLATLPPCLVGMEACCGAHHLGRIVIAHGHDARLIPPQFVRPFVKSHKNDSRDAEAIGEAVQRPTMRTVPLKTPAQLDLQAVHRVRTRLVGRRTAVINQIRAFLLERGLTIRAGRAPLRRALPEVLADADNGLSPRLCRLLAQLRGEWDELDGTIDDIDQEIRVMTAENDACRQLMTVPGIGPLTASALVAAIGNGSAFRRGRDFAAWLGLVPHQHSTGGKTTLLGISKRGNPYLRQLFIHGARSTLLHRRPQHDPLVSWLEALRARAHPNVVAVALANKLARIAWAVLRHHTIYRGELAVMARS
jgi:transposase